MNLEGGISAEEDEPSKDSNQDISLGTISTDTVSEEEDGASMDGRIISSTTSQEEDSQQPVRPFSPWRGISRAGHILKSEASSLPQRTTSFVKPLSRVGPILRKKRRSALTTARRWLKGAKANTKQRVTLWARRRERESNNREQERRKRNKETREKRYREEDKIFGRPDWKRRLVIKLILSIYPKKWKCSLGERIRKRIGEIAGGHQRPYVVYTTDPWYTRLNTTYLARKVR